MIEIVYTLVVTHITIVCVTLFLHRGQAHRSLIFSLLLSHFMRFWLWLTTGMRTKEWVAVHRKHHRFTEEPGDPHSPHIYGIKRVIFSGWLLYHDAAKDADMVNVYGVGTPDDWIERNLYSRYSQVGITLLLIINLVCFSWWGLLIWGIQMIWIPLHAAGIINGLGHWWGYKNGETRDESRNIFPFDVFIGGECLHNNHHLEPANPKLSRRWFEFDIGWMYIRLFKSLRLLSVR